LRPRFHNMWLNRCSITACSPG